MMEINLGVALQTVFTMFIVLCVGYIGRVTKIIDDPLQKGLSNLIIKIGQPFMIVSAVIKIEYSEENLRIAGIILAIGLGVHTVSALIAYFAALPLKKVPDERKISEFAILFANCGFMGIPVLRSLFGDIGAFWAAVYVVAFNIIQWTYGMILLGRDRDDIRPNLLKIFLNFGTTPCIVGILLFVTRLPIPGPVSEAMNYLGSLCTPISMLIVGAILAKIPVKKLCTSVKIFYYCAVKLVFLPLAVLFLCKAVGLRAEYAMFATVVAALPTASNTVMFGESYDISPEYAAHSVAMSTFLSAATIPCVLLLAKLVLGL